MRDIRSQRRQEIGRAERTRVCMQFTRELQQIDPHLELVFWPETAMPAPAFIPGRYHIVRHNPNAAGSVEPLVTPDGGYREPDSSIFDQVRAADLWNAEVVRDRRRMEQKALDMRAKRQAEENRQRREEIRDRIKAATETSVSMSDVPWSQNAAGARGRKAA